MRLFQSLAGSITATITTADQIGFLQRIRDSGIELKNVQIQDDLTIQFECKRAEYSKIRKILRGRGDKLSVLERNGLFWTIINLRRRPVLISGLLLFAVLGSIVPGHVFFVQVEGNAVVPTRLIVETAAQCGITIGMKTRNVRSEDVKNLLLSRLPQLEWVGVNTNGCVAMISVKERNTKEEEERQPGISSIYAKDDGIILSATAYQGSLLCKPGDAVVAGQKLISGLMDHGICIRGTAAKGSIVAMTDHHFTTISPSIYVARAESRSVERKYALLIGKKRINLYKGSGILDTTCAKIKSVWYITLPGGFAVPLGIACETYTTYRQRTVCMNDGGSSAYAYSYILSQLVEGQILSYSERLEERDDAVILYGHYICRESLGISRTEENFEEYGKDP